MEDATAVVILWRGPWGTIKEAANRADELGLEYGCYLGFGKDVRKWWSFLQWNRVRYVGISKSSVTSRLQSYLSYREKKELAAVGGNKREFWVGQIISKIDVEATPSGQNTYPALLDCENALIVGLRATINETNITRPRTVIGIFNVFDSSTINTRPPRYVPEIVTCVPGAPSQITLIWNRNGQNRMKRFAFDAPRLEIGNHGQS